MSEGDTFFRELMDQAPVGLTVWRLVDPADDTSLVFVYANERGKGFMESEMVVGKRMVELLPHVTAARMKLYADVIRNQREVQQILESIPYGKDGRTDSFAIRARPMGDRVLVYFHNLSLIKREEEVARISLDQVIEHLPLMIFVKDAESLRFTRLNRAGEKLLGLKREDLIGKNDYDFFPKDQADHFVKLDRETLAGNVERDIPEEPIDTPDGKRWLHTKKVAIRDGDGIARYLLGSSLDITEARRATESVREAKNAAEASNRELEAFSYSVAHDLRAPLRAIDGFTATLEEDYASKLDEKALQTTSRIRKAASNMGRLVDDLLELSRLSRLELRREQIDLSALVREIIAGLRATAPERDVELVVEEGLVTHADRGLLRILFDNLLGNAFKFTGRRPKARIEVGARKTASSTEYFVRDDGVGFEMAYASKLFSPFERLHSGHDFTGSGIGLAIVQRIVLRHGGFVWAESEVDKGATFHFSLSGGRTV